MLGYIVSYRPELKVWESEIYKAYYCGVCKSIGKRYGQLPRMVLSFDAAFFALILDCIDDEAEILTREGCIGNPFKKKAIAHSDNIDFAGDIMVILAWYKMIDDVNDENKFYAKVVTKIFKRKFKKIYKKNKGISDKIEAKLRKLKAIEEEKTPSIDMPSHCFAQIMSDIFAEGINNMIEKTSKNEKRDNLIDGEKEEENCENNLKLLQRYKNVEIFKEIGYNIGKWVYLIDAVDDIEENIKTGAYNPLLYRYEYENGEDINDFKTRIKPQLDVILVKCLEQIGKAIDLLDVKKNKGILNNILYVGLLKKTDEILAKTISD